MRVLFAVLVLLIPVSSVLACDPPIETAIPAAGTPVTVSADPHDWPTYNHDFAGTRHNPAERALTRTNVGRLTVKWRYPPEGSSDQVGAIHATPIVVDGSVYFGTSTYPAVYRLTPDGHLKWKYVNPNLKEPHKPNAPTTSSVPTAGYLNSPLVTNDAVYIGDAGGVITALDRETGKEIWTIATREKPFPGAHLSNSIFSAPILADGKLIIAGGGFEHGLGADPEYKCCSGRGFVLALEPRTGAILWKYNVGPKPQKFDPPLRIRTDWGESVFHYGPSTSSVWATPSYDPESGLILFGTDTHNSPRRPTKDDPRLYTEHSCAVVAVDAATGQQKWLTQINPDDVWNYGMRAWDPNTGRYKDQSIGDTPKVYTIDVKGTPRRVTGVGCKNGGFYVLDLANGEILGNTPLYTGPPTLPPSPTPDPRTLAMPGPVGGLQTGCATDGKAIFTNGIDMSQVNTSKDYADARHPPTGGRVVSISLDTAREFWRHERPVVPQVATFKNVGDPVASGIALANGVAYFTTTVSNQLVALDTRSGKVLTEIPLGPVWSGPSISRGRVYVGTGNILFAPGDPEEAYFPKSETGILYSFGLPGEDEVDRLE